MNGEPMQPMDPWYKSFKGLIKKSTTIKEGGFSYTVSGIIGEVDETTLRITELPIRRWTEDYKEFLESMMIGTEKIKDPFIKDFRQHSGVTMVHFEVILSKENMMIAKEEWLLKKFKLMTTISTSNMHLFDARGMIKKYDTPEQILEEFFHLRIEFYVKRKKVMLDALELHLSMLDNKVRFILAVVNGEIVVNNRKRADLLLELRQKGFTLSFPSKSKGSDVAATGEDSPTETEEIGEDLEVVRGGVRAADYVYLLSMPIGSLTMEKVQELLAENKRQENTVEELRKETPKSLWMKDLDDFLKALDEQDREDAKTEEVVAGAHATKASRQVGKNTRKYNTKKANAGPIAESAASVGAVTDMGDLQDAVKPKGRRLHPEKVPLTKPVVIESDEDDEELLELKERLAKYNIDSPTDQTAMETEVVSEETKRKEPCKRGAVKKPPPILTEISDDDTENKSMPTILEGKKTQENGDNDDDVDFEPEVPVAAPKGEMGRGRKSANGNTKTTATLRKRGPAAQNKLVLGQKLITEVLKPVGDKVASSPQKKVRKMRTSPFNKKSGSVLGRINNNKKGVESSPELGSNVDGSSFICQS